MGKIVICIGTMMAICIAAHPDVLSQQSDSGEHIRKWMVLGPIEEGKTAIEAIEIDYLREATEIEESRFATLTGAPTPGDIVIIDLEGYATQVCVWTILQMPRSQDNLNRMLIEDGQADKALAYLLTFVRSEEADRRELLIASDDIARAWVNGESVKEGRNVVSLRAGMNVLMVKVANTVGDWVSLVRFANDRGLEFFDTPDGRKLPIGKRINRLPAYEEQSRVTEEQKLWTTYHSADGLADDTVTAIQQDRDGSMWFGTQRGASRFNGREWTTYSQKELIADSRVRAVHRDIEGNLWFATANGVSRFDGKDWVTYTSEDGLANDYVYAIHQGLDGSMWFGTLSGVSRFDGRKWTAYTTKDGLAHDYVWAIDEDIEGNVWFGTWGGGVSRFDGREWITYTAKDGLGSNWILDIYQGDDGDLWFATRLGGVSRFDREKWTTYNQKVGLAYNYVWAIYQDHEGNMWFGTYGGGASRFDGKEWTTYTAKDGLASNHVYAIHQDREGNMWFGTEGGVSCLDIGVQNIHSIKEILKDKYVYAIHQDVDGSMWFGTDANGVFHSDGEKWINYTVKDGLADECVYAIYRDNRSNFWFGTRGGVSQLNRNGWVSYTTKEGLAGSYVHAVYQDNKGNMWFGTEAGVSYFDGSEWRAYNQEDGLVNNWVYAIDQDNKGDIWFATYGGVSRFNGKEWATYTTKEGLSHSYVWAVRHDNKGNMWFGTRGGGLSRFDNKGWTTYIQEDGLANNWVFAINQDNKGNMWFGTYRGISIFDGRYFHSVGIKNESVSEIVSSIYKDKAGNIWVGTDGGIIRYAQNEASPLIRITQIVADKSYDNPKGTVRLPAYTQSVSFTFHSISFKSDGGIRFLYRLMGRDIDWQGPTDGETVEYHEFEPGEYIFQVQAVDRDLDYSDTPASLTIVISPPPFYESRLFIILLILCVFIIPTAIYSSILIAQRRKARREFEPIPNPYMAGGPIRSKEMFFGREEDFRFVSNKLRTEKEGVVIVFHGQRRSGKTSILHQIYNGSLGEGFMPVLIDMQEMAVNNDEEFYEKIAEEVSFEISKRFEMNVSPYNFRAKDANPAFTFEKLIDEIIKKSGDRTLLLMFDEYELLEVKMDEGILSSNIPTFLAGILERHSETSLIFTGSRHIKARKPEYWEVLFGKSVERRINLLNEVNTLSLVKEPVDDVVRYQRGVPERIYRLTGGQPFYSQYICQLLVESLNQLERYKVYASDVDKVALELVDSSPMQMEYFWSGELEDKEKLALILLAKMLNKPENYVSASIVAEYAAEQNINSKASEMEYILDGLCEYELLERARVSEETYEYRFRIDLFRRWLQRHHSISQMMRDINERNLDGREKPLL